MGLIVVYHIWSTQALMKSRIVVLSLLTVLMVSALAPSFGGRASAAVHVAPVASATQTHGAFLDKTKFIAHIGVAYYAFHHFIYLRFKNGGFQSGAKGRIGNFVKAALAGAFAYHEVRVALGIANNGNSAILGKLVSPLNSLSAGFGSLLTKLQGKSATASDFNNLNSQATSFQQMAGSKGAGFNDIPVSVPGAA